MSTAAAKAKIITAYAMRIGADDPYVNMIGLSDTLNILIGDETMRALMLNLLAEREAEDAK